MYRNKKLLKILAVYTLINLLTQLVFPGVAYALTAGPASPEFSSFEPVATTDMVDVFSGNFTYNLPVLEIPGPDGGGYAMSLSYHSGVSSEEEASWVGFGWSLNPGAINRNVRGYPDDFNGADVDIYNKTRANWSVSSTLKANTEIFSQSKKKQNSDGDSGSDSDSDSGEDSEDAPPKPFESPNIGLSTTLRYNNYQGFTRSYSLSGSYKFGSVGVNASSSGITFSAAINPFKLLNAGKKKSKENTEEIEGILVKDAELSADEVKQVTKAQNSNNRLNRLRGSSYGLNTFSEPVLSSSLSKYKGYAINYSIGGQINALTPNGFEGGILGSYSMQYNVPKATKQAYGYANTPDFDAVRAGDVVEDYYVEKSQGYDKRDYFLGIPFSTPDNYILSGEGLGGGFRAHKVDAGHYYPNFVTSQMPIYDLGVEFMSGGNFGLGFSLNLGYQNYNLGNWWHKGETDDDKYQFGNYDPVYRFTNDLGGKVELASNDLFTARVEANPNVPFIKNPFPFMEPDIYEYANQTSSAASAKQSIGRSSYIDVTKSGNKLSEFNIYNEGGLKYNYDQPVYAKNDVNISVDLHDGDPVYNNHLTTGVLRLDDSYDVDHCAHEVVMGEIKREKYATAHLLTSITSPDFIDVNANGEPDPNDFGGWTNFDYHQKYGSFVNEAGTTINNFYRWRTPYAGMSYQKGQISDLKDDVGSVSCGEKEVFYLKKVETKTHVAYFVTNKSTIGRFGSAHSESLSHLQGSGNDRLDGLGAKELSGSMDPAALDLDAKSNDQLEYLEKIVLFAKDRPGKPLKTTYFEYDYSLVKNLPNNLNGNYPNARLSNSSGKLTLKKVWTEYEGTIQAKISPYEFDYNYKAKNKFASEVIAEKSELADFFNLSNVLSINAQNPDYAAHQLGPWGFNQVFGDTRKEDMRPWLFQGDIQANEPFDPAAWQLKRIKLPSGGEILIQYEQKDYQFVQDRRAMSMVSLLSAQEDVDDATGYDQFPTYKLNLADIGYDANDPNDYNKIEKLADSLRNHFLEDTNLVYFKYLYALKGDAPSLSDCKSEYIDGYVRVADIVYDNNDHSISIVLNGAGSGYEEDGYAMVPRQGCYDFYSTQRVGQYEYGCEGYYSSTYDATSQQLADATFCPEDGPLGAVTGMSSILGKFGFATEAIAYMAYNSLPDLRIQPPLKSTVCKTLNTRLSYLRIPIFKAKRGGGVRVKRLMMYDPGIESGDAAIYGNEYSYINTDGTSSGVATTEPALAREENPLVDFLPKKKQSWLSRHIVGSDKEQSEGPLGESLLPGASVGHSRVVVENIHKGKTGTGFTVHEFNTCKDYPYDKVYSYIPGEDEKYDLADDAPQRGVDMTDLSANQLKDVIPIQTGVFNYIPKKFWMAQGFRFIQNQMHGKPRSVKSYGGNYSDINSAFLTSGQEYNYYEPGEMVRVLKEDGSVEWTTPGKEMDVSMEMKSLKDKTMEIGFEMDISADAVVPPVIYAVGFLSFTYNEKVLATHTTSKVISYPVIQKSVTTVQDGIKATTDYLAFDEKTGKPILSRTRDIYDGMVNDGQSEALDGSIYTLNMPAHWHYEEMGAKSDNVSYTNQLSALVGSVVTYGSLGDFISEDNNSWSIPTGSILSANASTFDKGKAGWFDSGILSEYGASGQLSALNNIWRPSESYVYRTETSNSAVASVNKVYEGGIYEEFTPFDYSANSQGDDNWLLLNEITKYSPNGNALEERNILDIYSAAKFGYDHTQPVMIAQNAQYDEIFFNDYEDLTPVSEGHSGQSSLEINGNTTIISAIEATNHLKNEGAWLHVWIKGNANSMSLFANGNSLDANKVAQTGAWKLYRAWVKPTAMPAIGNTFDIAINGSGLRLDDVRFQPKDAQATCYVYDKKSLRLITQFDDQHFGLYYQYDAEGKLVRKLVETERGLKTIQETQYNTPRVQR